MNLPTRPAWFRHRVGTVTHLGVFDPNGDRLLDCGPADPGPLLGPQGPAQVRRWIAAGTLLATPPEYALPLAHPGKILCLGKNFADHAAEFGSTVPDQPMFFAKLPGTLLPAGQAIRLPFWLDSRVDHEIELGLILGFDDPQRQGRRYVSLTEATGLVAGYTILNDVTARHMQGEDRHKQHPWLRCKSFDTFCPLGPFVVCREDLPEVADLQLRCEVGGEVRQESRTSLMVVDIPHAISWLSRHTNLHSGDIIAMGTPAGVGPLRPGDRVDCWIEQLGTLSNPVEREDRPAGDVGPW